MENILYMSSEDLWMHLCPQYDVAPDLSADLTMSLNEYHWSLFPMALAIHETVR